MGRSRWDPWRAFGAAFPDVEVEDWELEGCRGMVEVGPPTRVMLDIRLGRRERRSVLGHEYHHLELGLVWPQGAPWPLVEKGEAIVRRRTADRFVPPADLAAFVRRRAEEGPVTATDVVEEFDISVDVALDAMHQLARRWAS